MHKRTGVVYRVRGNVSLWDMSAVLVPNDIVDEFTEDNTFVDDIKTVDRSKMKRDYIILDEGYDPLPTSAFAPIPLNGAGRSRKV